VMAGVELLYQDASLRRRQTSSRGAGIESRAHRALEELGLIKRRLTWQTPRHNHHRFGSGG